MSSVGGGRHVFTRSKVSQVVGGAEGMVTKDKLSFLSS